MTLSVTVDRGAEVHGAISLNCLSMIVGFGRVRGELSGVCHLPAERTVCLINPENAISIRVASKAGYVQTHVTTYNSAPTLMFERARVAS